MRPDAPLTHDAAVALVREWHAADCRRGLTEAEWIAGGYPVSPDARGRWVRTVAGMASMAGMPAAWLPGGRAEYWDALRIAAVRALRSGEPMPPELRDWLADVLDGTRPCPKLNGRPSDTRMRDVRIQIYAVRLEARGMQRTRDHRAGPRPCGRSAADAIGAALGMSYKRVADIISGAGWQWALGIMDILGTLPTNLRINGNDT